MTRPGGGSHEGGAAGSVEGGSAGSGRGAAGSASAGAVRKRARRVATYVSEVDRRLIAQGIAPSWEDRVREEDAWPGSMRDAPDRGDGANDRRLLDDVPPHWQPRA